MRQMRLTTGNDKMDGKTRSPSDPDQHQRFLEAARELGTDDDKERFETKLGKVAKVKAKDIRGGERHAQRKVVLRRSTKEAAD
jgi:hypothetical protein